MQTFKRVRGGRMPAAMTLVLTVLNLALLACANDTTDPTGPGGRPQVVASIEVMPGAASVAPGVTVQLAATPRTAAGAPVAGRSLSWSTSDHEVATVTAQGMVRAVGVGVAKVWAQVDGRQGEAVITVADPENPRPTLAALSPNTTPAGSPGVTIVLAGAGFAPGAQVIWNGTPRPAQWISAAEIRLTLASTQLVQEGIVQIAVRNPGTGGEDSEALPFRIGPVAVDRVTVSPASVALPAGSEVELFATAYAADGSILTGRSFSWTSSAAATASVLATGVVTGHHVGEVLITVESEGRTASVRVSVVPSVAYVSVTPNAAAVLAHVSVQLTAVTYSASGGVLTGRPVTWWSENPLVATVDQTGLVTGLAKGSARIRAESEGKVGWGTVEVREFAEGPVQPYVLRGVADGLIMPAVGTTTWVDEQGVAREATLFLVGGEITLDHRDSRYEQTLLLDVLVPGRGSVRDEVWTDEGSFRYQFTQSQIVFTSSRTGGTFTAYSTGAGELTLEQTVGTAPALRYRWIIQ